MSEVLHATPNGAIGSSLGGEADTLSSVNPAFLPQAAASVQLGDNGADPDPPKDNPTGDGDGDAGAGDAGGEGEGTPPEARELKYSEETYTAARDEADAAGFERGRTEYFTRDADRRRDIAASLEGTDLAPAPVLRNWETRLGQMEVAPEEAQGFLTDARNVFTAMVEGALVIAGDAYHQAISLGVPEARRAAFQVTIADKEQPAEVAIAFANEVALEMPAVVNADPEDLYKVNKKLATQKQLDYDQAYAAGRKQGQIDPVQGRTPNGESGSSSSMDWNGYRGLPQAEKDRLEREDPQLRIRLMSEDAARRRAAAARAG